MKEGYDTTFVVDSVTYEKLYYNDFNSIDSAKIIYTYGWFPLSFGLQTPSEQRIIEGFGYESYGPFISGGEYLVDYCLGTDADCGFLTSNKNIYSESIKLYPNPSDHFIQLKGMPLDASVKIYNLNGILQRQSQENLLDTSSFVKGMYIIEVSQQNQVIWRDKFLKI